MGYNFLVIGFILVSSIFLSIYFKFYSLRNIKTAFRELVSDNEIGNLMTSLSATLGTGNIIGVGIAIALGGPGALLWMIVVSLFGSILQFMEGALTVRYKKGPMEYLNTKKLKFGYLYAFLVVVASFIIGNLIQVSSIMQVTDNSIFINLTIFACVFLSIVGNIDKIKKIAEKVIPFITITYIIISLIIIIVNFSNIIPAISLMVSDFGNINEIRGGVIGGVVKYGISYGIFTNEAGLGTGAIAFIGSKKKPCQTGLIASLGVIIDTVIMCLITGLVILVSDISYSGDGNLVTINAFINELGLFGKYLIQISLIFYGFMTILGWYYIGYQGFDYLLKGKYISLYKGCYLLCIILALFIKNNILWFFADQINIILAIVNITGLILLRRKVKLIIKNS